MKEHKEASILCKGTYSNIIYTKNEIKKCKFPKVLLVEIHFNPNRIVGKAKNFKIKDGKIVCDITYDKTYKGFTVAPRIKGDIITIKKRKYMKWFEIDGVSIISRPYPYLGSELGDNETIKDNKKR